MPIINDKYYSAMDVEKAQLYAKSRGMEKHWEIYLPSSGNSSPAPVTTHVHHHHSHTHRAPEKKYDEGDLIVSGALGLLTGGLLF